MTRLPELTRRRTLGLMAAALGVGAASPALLASTRTAAWRGLALGGEATIQLVHRDGDRARTVLDRTVAQLKRLEAIFSLYDETSVLSRLNAQGFVKDPPPEFYALLLEARRISEATHGLFDITVQPLWQSGGAESQRVGQGSLVIARDRIAMQPGQAVTLNGIAQGAITDHLMTFLKNEGFEDILLNTGEIRANGHRGDGAPWTAALGTADGPHLVLGANAVATTARAAHGVHLFNPATGQHGSLYREVSVVAPTATIADGLSTAFALMPEQQQRQTLARLPWQGIALYVQRDDGSRYHLTQT